MPTSILKYYRHSFVVELAQKYNIEITKEQAEAYFDELQNIELDTTALDKVAGGGCYMYKTCPVDCKIIT